MEGEAVLKNAGEMKWTKEKVYKLVELLEMKECLWRKSHGDYKNKAKRNAAFAEIADQLGSTAEDVNNKVHNLRCQYRNEVKKERTRKSGAGCSDMYISKWEFFKPLNFLYGGGEAEKENTFDSMSNTSIEIEVDIDSMLEESQLAPSIGPSTSGVSSDSRRKRKRETAEDEALKKCMAVLDKHVDSLQVFGDYVASSLRNLSERAQCQLKISITELIVNAQKEHLESLCE